MQRKFDNTDISSPYVADVKRLLDEQDETTRNMLPLARWEATEQEVLKIFGCIDAAEEI